MPRAVLSPPAPRARIDEIVYPKGVAREMTIKRSPVVLFRTFALIEVVAFAAYLLAVGHGNAKADFYNTLFFSGWISYQTAKFLLLAGAQFVITVYAFLGWYYETYTISPGKILHRSGVFFKKEKMVPLEKSIILTLSSGPVGKMFHYGSILIENGARNDSRGSAIVLADISYPEMHIRAIEKMKQPPNYFAGSNPADIEQLIGTDEHSELEFKSSLRIDRRQGGVNRDVEKAAMKTIAAFMNSNGGNLVLGVDDNHEVVGLADDYASLPRKSSDGFENHFTQVFNRALGPENRNLVQLQFQSVGGREVAVVRVAKSSRPVYLKMDDSEYFYVRTGNGTTPLKLSEVEAYSRTRWPRRVLTS